MGKYRSLSSQNNFYYIAWNVILEQISAVSVAKIAINIFSKNLVDQMTSLIVFVSTKCSQACEA